MKKNFSNVLLTILCVLLVFCLFKIYDLENQLVNMQNNITFRISDMEASMMNHRGYMEELLNEEASILAKSEWSLGNVNVDDYTIELECKIAPKEYQPEVTKATLVCNDEQIPMELIGGEYVAKTQIPLFDDSEITQVIFTEGEKVRTEALGWGIAARHDCLPGVSAYFDALGNGKAQKGQYLWNRSGTLEVFVENKGEAVQIASAALVRCIDGEEVERMELSLEKEAQLTSVYQQILNLEYQIPFGSTQDLYVDVEVENQKGIIYRVQIDHTVIDEEGYLAHDGWESNEAVIYDKNGKELYNGN